MTWIWDQSAGELRRGAEVIARGYSGHEWGKNNPAADASPGIGPIPRGRWRMTEVRDSPNTGPYTITLVPGQSTDTHRRSAFRIHGDSIRAPGTASHGCIILHRAIREKLWASDDRDLEVVT